MAVVLLGLTSCQKDQPNIYIRIHNSSVITDYTNVQIDPSTSGEGYIQAGNIAIDAYTDYVEVNTAKVLPVIDVSCFYNTYHYTPENAALLTDLDAGHYTYHVNIIDSNSTHYLSVNQTQD